MHLPIRTVLVLVLLAALSSCKKEEPEGPSSHGTPTASLDPTTAFDISAFSRLTVGNYWVYQRTTYDSTGVQVMSTGLDSIFFSNDTLINGLSYVVQRRATPGASISFVWQCLRDSADCLVNEHGGIVFRYGLFDQVMLTDTADNILYVDYTLFSTPAHRTVPAGTFLCFELLGTVTMIATGFPPVPPARYPRQYWSAGVGKVRDRNSYLSSGWIEVRELLRYNVH